MGAPVPETWRQVKAVTSFPVKLADAAALIDARLLALVDAEAARGAPPRLVAAMRLAVSGGKRIRPYLTLSSAEVFGATAGAALPAAAAVELMHCYSLVHDDLPCMDNDKMRRGQPTVWKAYDEWTAILVGDALQALAFESLTQAPLKPTASAKLAAVLASAVGASGMVGGQALDLEADKLKAAHGASPEDISRLQSMKTGRLISAACELGAIVGEASDADRRALQAFGRAAGYAFQIADDLLDAEGAAEAVGKATGKDAAAGKATLISLLGPARARAEADRAVDEALAALDPFGDKATALIAAARFMAGRDH